MSSRPGFIFRRPTDKTWWLEYVNAAGQRVVADTRSANEKVAEQLLLDIQRDIARRSPQEAA